MPSTLDAGSLVSPRYLLVAATLLLILALVAVARGAQLTKRTRADVAAELAAAQRTLADIPSDAAQRERTARLLYESGDFWHAAETIQPLLEQDPGPEALGLAAQIEYLLGHYMAAIELNQKLQAHPAANAESKLKAAVGLTLIYHQTNRFDLADRLQLPAGVELPHLALMRGFDQPPYRPQWQGHERKTEVPFVVTDPLPVLEVRFQNRAVHVLFDTGADMCFVDSETAQALGLAEITSATGAFGGGKPARIGFAKLQSLQIGGVTLADVPVMTLPTKRFSPIFGERKLTIEGIIGTGLARQFLTTIDYEHHRMVLRERAPKSVAAVRHELGERIVAEIPFVISGTHQMMARGSINGRDGLTFFVDSGLASEASLSAPPQTLEFLGIPKPKTRIDPRTVGGGGGKSATGVFPIESLGLGELLQHDLQGEFGSRTAGSYWEAGFIQDGLISHKFLRQYSSWTLDFDALRYIFAK